MATRSYSSVWDALLDSPEESANMQLRSKLMRECSELVKGWQISQKDAAKRLHITQPRLNDLLNGKISKFSIDALVTILSNADMAVVVQIEPRKKAAAPVKATPSPPAESQSA
ncbi:XRE family transcriptional regulator [Pseudomonas sp. A46]|nr:XRE family transcriptional regulator [Pseudomonas sp. A46]OWJ92721.1 XRE family transcriptional regulator [Pseudomonas sp. A46]